MTEATKIVADFWTLSVQIVSLFFCLFWWIAVFSNEITQWTVYLLRSKRLGSKYILLGKFLALTLFLLGIYVVWGLWFLLLWQRYGMQYDAQFALASWFLSFGKNVVFLALVVFLVCSVSPFIAIVTSLCVYFLGHMSQFLHWYVDQTPTHFFVKFLIRVVYYIFPSFDRWNMTDVLVWEVPFSFSVPWWMLFLEICMYTVVFLIFAVLVFEQKRKYGSASTKKNTHLS